MTGMIVDEIRAVMLAKANALIRRSADDITALLHADFCVVTAGGKRITRADYIDVAITGSRLVFHDQKVREIDVRPFGTTAIATMLLDDWYTVDGREIVETYHALFVYTQVDGRWLWAGGQAMVPKARLALP